MFAIFKSFFGPASNDSRLDTEIMGAIESLDIQAAMAAHENWKLRLMAYLDGTSKEDFVAEVICFDDRCDLGQWIHSTGKASLGKYPGFTALMGHHKMFHYAASNVVALTKSGKVQDARKMLDGQFVSFSKSVNNDLKMLGNVVARSQDRRKVG
jgi:hypothetical protein